MIARIRSVARSLPVAVAMALASVTTAAHGGVFFDVLVTSTGTGTQLVIGGFDDDGTATGLVPEGQMRVFQAEVSGAFSGTAAYVTGEPGYPGFQALAQTLLNNPGVVTPAGVYTALSPFTPLTFSFLPITIGADSRNLFFWDGIGAVDFSPVGANVVLSLDKIGLPDPWTQSINGGQNSVIPGGTIDVTTSAGGIHRHTYAAIAKDGGVPDQGFYLFSLQLQMTGYGPSESLYFVYGALDYDNIQYGQNLAAFDAAHALASDWVENNLVAVPEPSAAALLGLAAVALPLLCRVRSRRTR